MVALRVINGMERELVHGQWLQHLHREKRRCKAVEHLLDRESQGEEHMEEEGILAIQRYCKDCARFSLTSAF